MTRALRAASVFTALAIVVPAVAHAHFKLMEPASWIVEDERGDPQKAGPCGGTNGNAGTPTNTVVQAVGGQKLHVKVMETIYHPGHYRIALAVNSRAELPADSDVVTKESERGPRSVSATIQSAPKLPVLADGLFVHTVKATEPFETDVTLPNISCARCTLQIVEFMAEHGYNNPGGYFYHHCADLQITADPGKPRSTGWPAAH